MLTGSYWDLETPILKSVSSTLYALYHSRIWENKHETKLISGVLARDKTSQNKLLINNDEGYLGGRFLVGYLREDSRTEAKRSDILKLDSILFKDSQARLKSGTKMLLVCQATNCQNRFSIYTKFL